MAWNPEYNNYVISGGILVLEAAIGASKVVAANSTIGLVFTIGKTIFNLFRRN